MRPNALSCDLTRAGWATVAHLVTWVINLFGDASFLAALGPIRPKLRREILAWLRPAEALARKLLLIEAARLPKPNLPAPAPRVRPPARARFGRRGFAMPDPADWPVAFKAIPQRRSPRVRFKPRRPFLFTALALAERLEALARVAADPERYAARLGRRLHARPLRAARIAAQPMSGLLRDLAPRLSVFVVEAAAYFNSG